MNILKIFFHSIYIFSRIRILKLFFLLLYLPIEFDKIKFRIYRLQFRLILRSSKMRFNLIKKGCNKCLQKSSRQLNGILFINNNSKYNIIMYFIEYPKCSILYVLDRTLISFTIFRHLRMITLYLMTELKYLRIHVTVV